MRRVGGWFRGSVGEEFLKKLAAAARGDEGIQVESTLAGVSASPGDAVIRKQGLMTFEAISSDLGLDIQDPGREQLLSNC